MMIPFWQPRFARRRRYRVLVRPTRQGEFLVFPNRWHKGGRGVVLSRTLKNTLEAPVWGIADSVFLAGILLSLLLGFAVGFGMLLVMLVLAAAWGVFDARRLEARLADVTARGRPAVIRLTRERYELEYASQVNGREIAALLAGGAGVGIVGAVVLMASVVAGDGLRVMLAMILLPLGTWAVWRGVVLRRWKLEAFRHGVVAGDPIDVPLPEGRPEDAHV